MYQILSASLEFCRRYYEESILVSFFHGHSVYTVHFQRPFCGRVSYMFFVQLSRKLMMTEADLERSDKKADAADEYVAMVLLLLLLLLTKY